MADTRIIWDGYAEASANHPGDVVAGNWLHAVADTLTVASVPVGSWLASTWVKQTGGVPASAPDFSISVADQAATFTLTAAQSQPIVLMLNSGSMTKRWFSPSQPDFVADTSLTSVSRYKSFTVSQAANIRDAQAKKIELWADTGDRATPESQGINRAEGWNANYSQRGTFKYPEREVDNQLLREFSGLFLDKAKYGVLPWDADIQYAAEAVVADSDGEYWLAITGNRGVNPKTQSASEPSWRRWL